MDYKFTELDFENPSALFRLEDRIKGFLGFFLYNPLISLFRLRGDEHILDFGCGGGAGTLFLLKKLKEKGSVTCLDVSNFWMNRAKKRLAKFKNVRCVLGDIRQVDIPDRSFDIVSIVHVIHDIHPDERMPVLNSLAGKLKENGRLFIYEPTRPNHGISVVELETLMKNAGLKQKEAVLKKSAYIGEFQRKLAGEG